MVRDRRVEEQMIHARTKTGVLLLGFLLLCGTARAECFFPLCVGPFGSAQQATDWLIDANHYMQTHYTSEPDPFGGIDLIVELNGHSSGCQGDGQLKLCVCTSDAFPGGPLCPGEPTDENPDGTVSRMVHDQ
jgi:hypothetical protein